MKYSVHLIVDAENDIWDIYRYVAQQASLEKADSLLDNIEKTVLGLETLPLRGHYPPELEHIGILEFREIFFKPYRIIYRTLPDRVDVLAVIHGARRLPHSI